MAPLLGVTVCGSVSIGTSAKIQSEPVALTVWAPSEDEVNSTSWLPKI